MKIEDVGKIDAWSVEIAYMLYSGSTKASISRLHGRRCCCRAFIIGMPSMPMLFSPYVLDDAACAADKVFPYWLKAVIIRRQLEISSRFRGGAIY